MQPIGQIFGQVSWDVADVAVVLVGICALTLLLRLDRARTRVRKLERPTPRPRAHSVQRTKPDDDWTILTQAALKELARAPDVQDLHARASLQIDAAEHALNRLIAECAKVGFQVTRPTFEPMQQLVREPVVQSRPRSQSLAA